MKRIAIVALGLFAFAAACVAAHFAVIEIGREVVTLRTQRADGTWQSIRLWAVDDDGAVWLHSGGADWLPRFAQPEVELGRDGVVRRYRATPVPGPHARVHELLREKYGWVDRWVRFLGPDDATVCAVRLDPLP